MFQTRLLVFARMDVAPLIWELSRAMALRWHRWLVAMAMVMVLCVVVMALVLFEEEEGGFYTPNQS